ncbi:serine/threonine protein kinase [Histoplasma ohiense]|nr:serine/threonine protein kinase [Histoplasma ohiense (nom. inval.)]
MTRVMLFARSCCIRGVRMASTLIGRSGREYLRDKILKHNSKSPDLSVYLARCGNEYFVLKHVSPSIFEQSLELMQEFPETHRLQVHDDDNEAEQILIYNHFSDNLLSLVKNNPNMSIAPRKWILWELGQALKEFHAKNWIHIDVKPDNVMVDYCYNQAGQLALERVVLGDLDCSLKLKDDKLLRLPDGVKIGNVMWRSPEAQTGQGIGKPSDVFSYGLVCLYTITGVETLHPDFEQLKRDMIEPELEIMGRLISFFGPVPDELVTHVNNENWGQIMMAISEGTFDGGSVGPGRFEKWKEKDYPNLDSETKRFLWRMTNLSPLKRATMEELMEDPWWNM